MSFLIYIVLLSKYILVTCTLYIHFYTYSYVHLKELCLYHGYRVFRKKNLFLQGDYQGKVTATDQNDQELACIDMKLTLK